MSSSRWMIVSLALVSLVACGDDDEERVEGASSAEAPSEPAAPPVLPMACAGEEHTCLMKADGHVFCFGANLNGELGDGTRQHRWAPSPVVGLGDATAIACGQDHTCALRRGGAVTCWGANDHGQLGAGNTDVQLDPVAVQGLTDAQQIALGYDFSCARKADGTVACWGSASGGNLGPAVRDDQSAPRAVQGLGGATALAVGTGHACAIVAGGAVHCWGGNGFGQLGRGEGGSSAGVGPVQGVAGATAIALGNGHSCAATAAGVSCWGYDRYGQLGNGPEEADRSPVPVAVRGLPGPVMELGLGSEYSCARVADGRVFCWGYGGRLGIDDTEQRETATEVPGLSGALSLAIGYQHACVLGSAGAMFCWGSGANGRLGNGERSSRTVMSVFADVSEVGGAAPRRASFSPAPVESPPTPHVAVGRDYVCGVAPDGRVRCFGAGSSGRLGIGEERTVNSDAESYVYGITDARQLSAWWEAVCAVRASGELACWGRLPVSWENRALEASSLPMAIPSVTDAVEVAVGQNVICVRHAAGTVSCMGTAGSSGALGHGQNASSDTFVPVQGIEDAQQIAAGYATVCARRADGTLWCWGGNRDGQLGNGSTESSNVPVQVAGLSGVTDVDVDYYDACAVHGGGRVSCWGKNDDGQLGNGRMGDGAGSTTPVAVRGIRDAVRVRTYMGVTCVTRQNGEAACWGSNNTGQTGQGDDPAVPNVTAPAEVARGTDPAVAAFGPYVSYAPGMNFTCGLHVDGHVSCAGSTPIRRGGGFLGIGATRSRTPVAAPGFQIGASAAEAPATP